MIQSQAGVTKDSRGNRAFVDPLLSFLVMKLGISLRPMAAAVAPGELGRRAEHHGFDSLWFAGDDTAALLWGEPSSGGYDPFVALTFAASTTTLVRLGAVINVDQRDVIILAKEAASLDRLSGGRLELGLHAEDRERAAEFVVALQALWRDETPSFHGQRISFDSVWSYPKPLQPGGPAILLTPALRGVSAAVQGSLVAAGDPVESAESPRTLFLPLDSPLPTNVERVVYMLPTGTVTELEAAARRLA